MAKFDIFPLFEEDSVKVIGIRITEKDKEKLQRYCRLLKELMEGWRKKEFDNSKFFSEAYQLRKEVFENSFIRGWVENYMSYKKRKNDKSIVDLSEIIKRTESEVDYV